MVALIIVLSLFVLLIFPVFINLEALINIKSKKTFFNIKLFKVLRVISGYLNFVSGGIALHLSSKNAKIIPFKNIFSLRKRFKPILDFHIVNAKIFIENQSDLPQIYMLNGFLSLIGCVIKKYLFLYKPYVDFDFLTSSNENSEKLNVYFTATAVINILTIVISLLKIWGEKFIYYVFGKR